MSNEQSDDDQYEALTAAELQTARDNVERLKTTVATNRVAMTDIARRLALVKTMLDEVLDEKLSTRQN